MKIDATTFSTREVTLDIPADTLVATVAGHDTLILRVTGLGSATGRPVSRSIRIPAHLLDQAASDWDHRL